MCTRLLALLTSCSIAGPIAVASLLLPTDSIAIAQSEASPVDFLNGVWEGSYTCRQGLTKLRLEIQANSPEDIDVVFSFSDHPTNPGNLSGSFRMVGDYNPSNNPNVSGSLDLDATTWINRPSGYSTVDLNGAVSSSTDSIIGDVDFSGCSTFEVVKLDVQNAGQSAADAQNSPQPEPDSQNTAQINRSSSLDGPESVVAGLHQAIQDGDYEKVETYYCAAERVTAQVIEGVADPEEQGRNLMDAYLQIAYTLYSVDMSMLQYETVYTDDEGEGRAVVTVVGPVAVESSDGRSVLIPYRNFSALGRDWLRLIRENGEWKLCQNLDV